MTPHPVELELRRVELDLSEAEKAFTRWTQQLADFKKEVARLKGRRKALRADLKTLGIQTNDTPPQTGSNEANPSNLNG